MDGQAPICRCEARLEQGRKIIIYDGFLDLIVYLNRMPLLYDDNINSYAHSVLIIKADGSHKWKCPEKKMHNVRMSNCLLAKV